VEPPLLLYTGNVLPQEHALEVAIGFGLLEGSELTPERELSERSRSAGGTGDVQAHDDSLDGDGPRYRRSLERIRRGR
jgi:hypothetical protein